MLGVILVSGAVFLSAVMALAWHTQRRTGNAGWADAFWSFGLGIAGIAFALAPLHASAQPARQGLVAALVLLWSVRLGSHIAMRTSDGQEDARYAWMRREMGREFQPHLFWFLQVQAAAAFFLALSILLAAQNPAPLGVKDFAALALLGAAIAGEGLADRQLAAFRKEKINRDRICDAGLWSWSRHPNYFFEWLGWLAYPLLAINLSGNFHWGWLALSGPLFMYWLLVHVSGIPPLEAHLLRKHGAKFREYQKRVSAFVPLLPQSTGNGRK